jgi:hypothetical protein
MPDETALAYRLFDRTGADARSVLKCILFAGEHNIIRGRRNSGSVAFQFTEVVVVVKSLQRKEGGSK